MSRSSLLGATALSALLVLPAHATPTTLWELFTIDRVANLGAQWMVTALRGIADVTYAHMDLRPLDGRMVLTGLHVSPYEQPECAITVDRAVVQTAPLDQIAYGAVSMDVMGAEIGRSCFNENDLEEMAHMGLERLVLDRAHLDLDYTFSTGAMTVEVTALSDGIAEVHGVAEFDYFAVNIDTAEPVADLTYAALTVTDRGGWGALSAGIPPQMLAPEVLLPSLVNDLLPRWRDPSAPPTVESVPEPNAPSGDKDQAAPAPVPQPTPTPLANSAEDEAGHAFLESAVGAFARFAAAPGTLRLDIAPEAPVRLTEDMFEEFGAIVLALQPALTRLDDVGSGPMTAEDRVRLAAWVAAWQANGTEPPEIEDALLFARAFLTGRGAPRDPEMAIEILLPYLIDGIPGAVDMALAASDFLQPDFAYRIARQAAAAGNRAAFAQLDRLEERLAVDEVIAIQAADGAPVYAFSGDEPARDLRERAYASLTGLGAPRRYDEAYFYALLALASGDTAAGVIVDEIETMSDRMSEEDAEEWASFLASIRHQVTDQWASALAEQ
ncbi:hypothetical protein [Nioella nitratireducens]|uniref:hypothetical protein n=1 Tax=Nioella nitratireducens TaxID=1287720 RepID=UPI0011BA8EBB|nr:hypothetical protein [Nioella nitratireducens]